MRLRVISDSNSNVPSDWRARLSIIEVQSVVNFGQDSFFNDELTTDEMYRRLETATKPPTTAAPSPEQFARAYRQAAEEGAEEIVAVIVSSVLSATYNSARLGAELAPVPVEVWDSQHVSMAAGWQVIAAAEMAQAGESLPAVLDRLGFIREHLQMAFTPANLKYIIASGRVPRLRGTIGDWLSIKPILMTLEGKLEVVTQVRSQRRARETMLELVLKPFGRRPLRLVVGHCNVPGDALSLLEAARAYSNVAECFTFDLGVVLAALGGPGLLGLGAHPLEAE